MKTDNYLTLCLEQAAKSPLHYRHGCIIVRGGKVIGQGYNDYRPGFNGGALKHGRVAKAAALDGPAMADLKEKLKKQKEKPKQKPQQQQQQQPDCTKTFTPFEGAGGGHHANVPLSMHSEMMAIHSALAASSTLSSTAISCGKPSFKLPRSDKRKTRLRAEVLKRYVDTVCDSAAASGTAKQGSGQLQAHNNNKPRKEDNADRDDEEEYLDRKLRQHAQLGPVQHVLKDCRRAFHVPQSGEKHHHHQKRKEKEKNQKANGEGQYEYQYDLYGQQTQQPGLQQPSVSKRKSGNAAGGYDSTVHDVMTTMSREACTAARSHDKQKKDYKRSGKMKVQVDQPSQPEPMLLPKGQAGPTTTDRKKHPRLIGADVYVTRLGWCRGGSSETTRLPIVPIPVIMPTHAGPETANEDGSGASLSSSAASLPSVSSVSSGSLHDELLNHEPSPSPAAHPTAVARMLDPEIIRASRPCYRCISYMHSVGIKRVFWTTDDGEWEGGKVRDLVDALDSSMESVASGASGGPTGNGVFVTKHEVLMLKRLMGES
ncbi:hypothetical protein LTR85_012031 [Meristemomyces frigidus]|nr:hypothetical protein LTR85_012031 [Meristemomyces frigidus]